VPLASQQVWLWRANNRKRAWSPIAASPDPDPTRGSQPRQQTAHDERCKGTKKLLCPRVRYYAHEHQPPRVNEPQVPVDDGSMVKACLGERGGAADGPVESRDGGGTCHGAMGRDM
jgi:hypothetical protein